MDEIDALLADEGFCQNLLPEFVANWIVPSNEPLPEGAECDAFLDALDETMMLESGGMAAVSSELGSGFGSGASSVAESPSESDLAIDEAAIAAIEQDQPSTLAYLLTHAAIPSAPSSCNTSGGESSWNSNGNALEDQLDFTVDDVEIDLSTRTVADSNDDDEDDDEEDDEVTHNQRKRQKANAKGEPKAKVGAKKSPLFQPLRSVGELRLTDLEKQTLELEGLTIHTSLPLSKQDERILKHVRRKIRNKLSAQESRRKKRVFVDELESHLKQAERENRSLRAQLKKRSDALQKVTGQFNSLRTFIASRIRFELPSSAGLAPTPSDGGRTQAATGSHRLTKQLAFGQHRPAVMALFLCCAVLIGCGPGSLRTAGFFFRSSSNASSDEAAALRALSNVSHTYVDDAGRCKVALIAYACGAEPHKLDASLAFEEYYFDGRSFLDRNAASMRTLKRFADQSNVFRVRDASTPDSDADASLTARGRSAVDSLLNALRYSTARTLLRRTVSATSEQLAAKLKGKLKQLKRSGADAQLTSQQQSVAAADESKAQTNAPSTPSPASDGKLLDQRTAPGRTSLFKWPMNRTVVAGWWNNVMRTFVDEPCCSSHLY